MIVVYADTSAVGGAYLPDEPEHATLKTLLFEGDDPIVTSELTRVEFASTIAAAARAGRTARPSDLLDQFDRDCGEDGPLSLMQLDPPEVLPLARQLVGQYRLRTLDALHLAVAVTRAASLGDEVVLLSRDVRQREAAVAMGLSLR